MKLKRIISLALTAAIGISSFGTLSLTTFAAELVSYTWDLTNCGEASGNDGITQNNCTTLAADGTVSINYTGKITAPMDGVLSFNLSRGNTKATISSDGLSALGNGTHIYFYSSKQGMLTVYANANMQYAVSDNASSGYGSENQAKTDNGSTTFSVEANKYYRIRSTGNTSEIIYTKIIFEETEKQYSVNINNIANGTITVDKAQAKEGEPVTITAEPLNSIFELETLTVKGANGTDIDFVNNSDGTYTFMMPAQSVTINGTFKATIDGKVQSVKIGDIPKCVAIPSEDSKMIDIPVTIKDEYGGFVSDANVKVELKGVYSGVSVSDGKLIIEDNAESGEITIIASYNENIKDEKTITIYNPIISKIRIDGDRSAEIPAKGTNSFTYTAKAYDQHSNEIENTVFDWKMNTYDNTGVEFVSETLTVDSSAKEQTILISASSGNISGGMKVVVTEDPFNYKPIDGGFEIDNGTSNDYVRPIYAPHIHDDLLGQKNGTGKPNVRFIYYLSDKPKLALTSVGSSVNTYKRYAHMFIGIKDGKWLDEMDNITARYVYGHEEYEITDSSFDGKIKLTYTRSNDLDAMIVKAELPDSIKDKLVVASAGQGGAAGSQPTGGNSAKLTFNSSDATAAEIDGDNKYHLIGGSDVSYISGTANITMNYTVKDASAYKTGDVNSVLNSGMSDNAMVVGTTDGNAKNEIYWILTTEEKDSEYYGYIDSFEQNAEKLFENGIEYYKEVSEKVKVDTPDPYINAAITAQVMAVDASWDSPVITHGPMGWHVAFGGWRGGYGFVDAGWGERITSNATEFKKTQKSDGRIQAYANKDDRYNMGVVLVDALLQYWEWSGDDVFFKTTGYDFIKGHLKFMDKEMQVPGTNLYENWLDAWNTDNKWNNGAVGTIASAYTWRAYKTMAKMAEKFGYTEDADIYGAKAESIKTDMNKQLWDSDTGVFGEYRERFGQDRINTAPDLSSVYTPIDMGAATYEQEYQMLRFTDYAVPSLKKPSGFPDSFWNTIEFKYSSNRPPEFYSSDGLYIQEVMNNSLAYYENGQRDMAMKQFRACIVPLIKGRNAAAQGTAGHQVRASLENNGHIDFADTSSQYVRTAVEGLFGIKMDVPDGKVDITPGFPEEWKNASIETNYLSYEFKYEKNTDIFNISSEKSLSYIMHIPVRSSKIESVKVNGTEVTDYTVDGYVNVSTPPDKEAAIEVTYGNEDTAQITFGEIGGKNSEYRILSNGIVTAISDPQGVVPEISELNSADITVILADKSGNHTFFVTVEKDNMTAVLPVDIEIKDAIEIIDAEPIVGTNAGIKIKLINNTEKSITFDAVFSTATDSIKKENITITAKGTSGEILVPVKHQTDLTPGNNKVTALLTGDITAEISGEAIDWELKDKISNNAEQYETISLDRVVNQDLRTLHENTYDLTYDGDEHYWLPQFYWSTGSNTTRTVLQNGRSWWEHGANAVPQSLKLPANGGVYTTGAGIPFKISSENGNNAAFVSLYNQFPDKMNIPVDTDGSKLYFMLSVSTNNMQSRIENARITINFKDGSNTVLPLVNPDNIDDWLNYQQTNSYAESGYIESLDNGAHANIIALDLGRVKQIDSIDFECLSSEVLAGLLGVTVVKGEYAEDLTVSEIKFDKSVLKEGEATKASVNIINNSTLNRRTDMLIAHYDSNGILKNVKKETYNVVAGSVSECGISYTPLSLGTGDYIKTFVWDSTESMKPLSTSKKLEQ